MSDWLKVMLEEIERKKTELAESSPAVAKDEPSVARKKRKTKTKAKSKKKRAAKKAS